jgi:hypothetical protein
VFLRWLRPSIDDKERMESALRASAVEWVAVRLVGITEGEAKPVRMTEDGKGLSFTITRPPSRIFCWRARWGQSSCGRRHRSAT